MDKGLIYQFMRTDDNGQDLCLHGWDECEHCEVEEWPCDDSENQQWYIDSSISTQLSATTLHGSSYCLTVDTETYGIKFEDCSSDFDLTQQWIVEKNIDTDTYKFYSLGDSSYSMCLTDSDDNDSFAKLEADGSCTDGLDEFEFKEYLIGQKTLYNSEVDQYFYDVLYAAYNQANDVAVGSLEYDNEAHSVSDAVIDAYGDEFLLYFDNIQGGTRSFLVQYSPNSNYVWSQQYSLRTKYFVPFTKNNHWIEAETPSDWDELTYGQFVLQSLSRDNDHLLIGNGSGVAAKTSSSDIDEATIYTREIVSLTLEYASSDTLIV